MIYCPKCGIANREGSRFCNECGTKLPSSTSVHCPQCGAPNPPHNVFCEQCNTRLVPILADETPEAESSAPVKKGLSLPTKPTPPEAQPAGDWMEQLRSSMEAAPASEESATSESADQLPDWLSQITDSSSTSAAAEPAAATSANSDEVPDWLTSLGLINPAETPTPAQSADWLAQTPPEAPLEEHPPELEPAALMSSLRETGAMPAEDDVPEWLRELGTAPLKSKSTEPPPTPTGYEEEVPDWLQQLGTGALIPPSSGESANKQPAVQPPSPPAPTPPAKDASSYEGELPDWLRGLGTGVLKPPTSEPAASAPEPPAPPAEPWLNALRASTTQPQEDMPDWLKNLGTGALTPPEDRASEAPPPTPESAEDVPEWLRNLGTGALTLPEMPSSADKPIEPAPTSAEPIESAAPEDWLSALRAAAPVSEEEPTEVESAPVEPAEAVAADDWLSALRAVTPEVETPAAVEEPTAEAPLASAESEVPDWLQNLGTQPALESETTPPVVAEPIESALAPAAQPEPAADDWLSALRAAAPLAESEAEQEPTAEEPQAEEEPAPAAAATEMPDWLSSFRATVPSMEAEPGPTAESGELPDWLQETAVPEQAAESPISEIPDWLRGEAEIPEPETPQIEPAAVAASEEAVPDWLRDFGQSEPVTAPTVDDSEVPDWLREAAPQETPEFASETPAVEAPALAEAEELPDWLREAAATQPANLAEIEETPPAEESAAEATPVAELPDWLTSMQPTATPKPAAAPTQPEPTPAAQPAAPVTNLGAALAPGTRQPREAESVPAAELPDWLKTLRAGQPVSPPIVPSQPAESLPGLTQAEIPAWLEALRPKEGAVAEEVDLSEESEKEGVLAGLAHLLPAAPALSAAQGATAKLQIESSADDLARAGIFQELLSRPISSPTQVTALPSRALRVRRSVTQMIVAAVLLALVALPFVLNDRLPFLPVADALPISATVQAAVDTIANLPSNARVLVVFDYDGTQAGEMNQIASIVLRHLKAHGAELTIASLNPQGGSLARSAWNSIELSAFSTLFVPGQAVGVHSLLLNTGPYDLVIDLSASADAVRWWVEQIALTNQSVKFIAGVSAGAESLALPYAQSKQIAGLISGAVGALQYAHQAQLLPTVQQALQAAQAAKQAKQSPSNEVVAAVRNQLRLESQTLGHWVMIGVIVLGLIGGLVTRLGRRSA